MSGRMSPQPLFSIKICTCPSCIHGVKHFHFSFEIKQTLRGRWFYKCRKWGAPAKLSTNPSWKQKLNNLAWAFKAPSPVRGSIGIYADFSQLAFPSRCSLEILTARLMPAPVCTSRIRQHLVVAADHATSHDTMPRLCDDRPTHRMRKQAADSSSRRDFKHARRPAPWLWPSRRHQKKEQSTGFSLPSWNKNSEKEADTESASSRSVLSRLVIRRLVSSLSESCKDLLA